MSTLLKAMNPFHRPSALELAIQNLEDAERQRLTACQEREFYVAMETMLGERIVRLRKDIRQLTEERQRDQATSGG